MNRNRKRLYDEIRISEMNYTLKLWEKTNNKLHLYKSTIKTEMIKNIKPKNQKTQKPKTKKPKKQKNKKTKKNKKPKTKKTKNIKD